MQITIDPAEMESLSEKSKQLATMTDRVKLEWETKQPCNILSRCDVDLREKVLRRRYKVRMRLIYYIAA